jgi:hypothetical protein
MSLSPTGPRVLSSSSLSARFRAHELVTRFLSSDPGCDSVSTTAGLEEYGAYEPPLEEVVENVNSPTILLRRRSAMPIPSIDPLSLVQNQVLEKALTDTERLWLNPRKFTCLALKPLMQDPRKSSRD